MKNLKSIFGMTPSVAQQNQEEDQGNNEQQQSLFSPSQNQGKNGLLQMMQLSAQKKKAPLKQKLKKSKALYKETRTKDPCLSFGCECAVCKQHIIKLRREGDKNAIKAFQDEKDYEIFIEKNQIDDKSPIKKNSTYQYFVLSMNKNKNKSIIVENEDITESNTNPYDWLIEHLLSQNERIYGCQILIPDTVVFEQGKPKYIAKTDKDGFIVVQKSKLSFQELWQNFSKIIRERKRETDNLLEGLQVIQQINNILHPNQNGNNGQIQSQTDSPEKTPQKMYYKDSALMRFSDGTVRVLNETELFDELKRRINDPFWTSLHSIQTTVKSKIGTGKPYNFTFKTPCFKKDKAGNITPTYDGDILEFDFRQFGNNDVQLQQSSPIAYCLKVCHKIGYYLLKIHNLQLLRMKCEFYQDENQKIWLFNVTDILYRVVLEKQAFLFSSEHQYNQSTIDYLNNNMKNSSITPEQKIQKDQTKLSKKEKELLEIDKDVDKELSDLVFKHRSQRGKQINMETLKKEVQELKDKAEEQLVWQQQQEQIGKSSTTLLPDKKSIGKIQKSYYHQMSKEHQRKKVTDIMGSYYENLKDAEDLNKELINSQFTDISTTHALKDLRPQCPLKMQELIKVEGISNEMLRKKREKSRQNFLEHLKQFQFSGKSKESLIQNLKKQVDSSEGIVRSIMKNRIFTHSQIEIQQFAGSQTDIHTSKFFSQRNGISSEINDQRDKKVKSQIASTPTMGQLTSTKAGSIILESGRRLSRQANLLTESAKQYRPPIKSFEFPSNNPFYNGSLTNKPLASANIISKKHLDFSNMSKNQKLKIQNILQQRAKYLDTIKKRNNIREFQDLSERGNDMSYEKIISLRDKVHDYNHTSRKDHFFSNEYVYE